MANIIGLDLNVDQDFLAEAVKQSVIMGISESLNGKNEIVSQIVKMALGVKVNDKGVISTYSSDNKQTLLEYHVKKLISDVLKDELEKIMEERRPEVEKVIREELSKQVNIQKFADRFFSTVSDAISSTWVPRIFVDFERTER